MSTNTPAIVTDGELGKLAVKQHELFTRVKKGVLQMDQVLAALQSVIEGKDPVIPTLNAKMEYKVWRTITYGDSTAKELIKRIVKEHNLGDYAKSMMNDPKFTVAKTPGSADLIVLSIKDLGFTKNPRTDEFMTAEFCADWSAKHLDDGYVIELCSPEDGPQLRLQYVDQPSGDYLWMAMERIAASGGVPGVFGVGRHGGGDGDRWLGGSVVSPVDRWVLDYRFVFHLRKIA